MEPSTSPVDDPVANADVVVMVPGDARFIAPPTGEAPPGWCRVCTDITGPGGVERPCLQVRVPDREWTEKERGSPTTADDGTSARVTTEDGRAPTTSTEPPPAGDPAPTTAEATPAAPGAATEPATRAMAPTAMAASRPHAGTSGGRLLSLWTRREVCRSRPTGCLR